MRAVGLCILGLLLAISVNPSKGAACITSCDEAPGFGRYSDCSSCDGYFLCYGMFKYRMPCAPGTEFHSGMGVCVHKSLTCPESCEVGEWSDWPECPLTCGGATRTRSRDITAPAANGGQVCPDLTETETCNDDPCPVDCEMNSWGSWDVCSKTCGSGTQTRSRSVQTQAANGGTACPETSESQNCNTQTCADISCPEAAIIKDPTRNMCLDKVWHDCDHRTGPTQGNWYRFVGEQDENLVIPEYPPEEQKCNTHAPGWLNSPHPTDYEVHNRTVCYKYWGDTCQSSNQIQTQRCDGYYVYKLYYFVGCHLRICTASMTHRGKPDEECP